MSDFYRHAVLGKEACNITGLDKCSYELNKIGNNLNRLTVLYHQRMAQKRLTDLDKLLQKAFEQLPPENLSETQFKALTGNYETERQELTQRFGKPEHEIRSEKDTMLNVDRFPAVVGKYTDIQKLTPEIVREFIEKIARHERSEPWKKKNYTQQVDVYFNFVGRV